MCMYAACAWMLVCILLQAKHMLMLKDTVIQDIIQFLECCEGTYVNGIL